MKMKKLNYTLGRCLDNFEVPNDWRKCKGINAKRTETNMGLADRDFSIKCKCSRELIVAGGFWVWWCDVHNQPQFHCATARMNEEIDFLQKKINDIESLCIKQSSGSEEC